MPDHSSAGTSFGHIVVDDRPFFGTAVWAQCSDGFGSDIADGINLFLGDGCSKDDGDLTARLADTDRQLVAVRGEVSLLTDPDVKRVDLRGQPTAPQAGAPGVRMQVTC